MRRFTALLLAGGVGAAAAVAAAAPAFAGPDTVRVSVGTGGQQGESASRGYAASGDGRYVLFGSEAGNLVPGDTNNEADLFVRDRRAGRTSRVSVASDGAQADGGSSDAALSRDGRYVAFASAATNLVPGDTNGEADVFLRDRATGRTSRVSLAADGGQGNGSAHGVTISADGRYVAYASGASNLVAGDTNDTTDVFGYDRSTGRTSRISVGTGGTQGDGFAGNAALSADGRYVAFSSQASNLLPGETVDTEQAYVHDRRSGRTELVSRDSAGGRAATADAPAISADGRHVAFQSSSNLDPADVDEEVDVFLRDRRTGRTSLVSGAGGAWPLDLFTDPVISPDGRYVAFHAGTVFLARRVPPGEELIEHEALYDRRTGTTTRLATALSGEPDGPSHATFFTADGRYAGFTSAASNLVAGDTNERGDTFLTRLR
jgi:Tol biopolymer transport system component